MTTPTTAWEALHRAQITLARRLQGQPEFRSMSFREYDVLDLISRAGDDGIRLNRLNRSVPLTQSSLSRLLERLENRGYVHRWQDPHDLRGLRIRLTEHGRTTHANIANRHHDTVHELMTAALTPEELTTLTTLTNKLRQHTQ